MSAFLSLSKTRLVVAGLGLLCSALQAQAQVQIESPDQGTLSYRDRLAVIALGDPGLPMILAVNSEVIQTLVVRPDRKAEFLNIPMPQGPSVLKVSQVFPDGQTFADSVCVHVLGPAARVSVEIQPPTLPADSLSQAEAQVRVQDAWGMPLPDGQLVTVRLDRGTILATDLYPEQPGIQVQVHGRLAQFQVRSPASAGEGVLAATADGVTAQAALGYTLPREKWMVVGTTTGQAGWRKGRPPPTGVATASSYKRGRYSDGRVAVYARGTVKDRYLLVTSFDSDRRYDNRVFRFLTPETVYPIRGDASSIFYEAPSASRLFARLSKDRSYVQYGDFSTALAQQNELSAYHRSFTGLSTQVTQKHTAFSLFAARTDQAIQVDEMPGEGVSGYYYLSAARQGVPLVEGSERVVLQTRERLHPERILKEQVHYRFTDYEIDYDAGTLLFKRPVPGYDADENPVLIVVTYETARSLNLQWTGGGRGEIHAGQTWEMGATVVGEERAQQPYWLTGLDAQWQPVQNTTFISEVARSAYTLDGWAWKFGARGRLRGAFQYDLSFRNADRAFDNPSSTTAQPGFRKSWGQLSWTPANTIRLTSEAYRTEDRINDEKRLSAALGGRYRWRSFSNVASVEWTRADRQQRETRSAILNVGTEWAATRRLTLGAKRDQTFGDEELKYRPTLTHLQTRWKLNERIDFLVEHAFRDGGFIDSSFTAVGLQSQLADDLNAYANYKLDGGINGRQNQAVMGLRHQYRPYPDLSFHTAFERVWTLRGMNQDEFYAYRVAGEYLPQRQVKASARFEQRQGSALDKLVASTAADFTLAKTLSLLTKYTYLGENRTDTRTSAALRNHRLATGLAYRANHHDYVNALGKYEYKYDFNSVVNPATIRSTHVGSFETILEPRSQIEWFVRYAFKVSRLSSEGIASQTLTDLWMTNVRLEWPRDWDVLGEYRLLTQRRANDRNRGAALEVGRVVRDNSRLAVGYNFAGYQDEDFAGFSYWAHGPYLKVQLKFTETDVGAWLGGLQGYWR